MLRRSKTDRAAAAAADALDQATASGVLVVNDDEAACELLSRVIEGTDAVAVRARDADSAVQAMTATDGIGAVVLDFFSGTATSFSVLEAIRQQAGDAMPAIMMIATTSANRTLAFDSGVDEFLTRPFHIDEFKTAVADMVARSPEEREARRRQQSHSGPGLQDLQD